MSADESMWAPWERLRNEEEPDPLAVLRAASRYQSYFSAVEREAIVVARKLGRTWEEIADAVGQSRQAVWQRARRDPEVQLAIANVITASWQAVKADPDAWYSRTRPYSA